MNIYKSVDLTEIKGATYVQGTDALDAAQAERAAIPTTSRGSYKEYELITGNAAYQPVATINGSGNIIYCICFHNDGAGGKLRFTIDGGTPLVINVDNERIAVQYLWKAGEPILNKKTGIGYSTYEQSYSLNLEFKTSLLVETHSDGVNNAEVHLAVNED